VVATYAIWEQVRGALAAAQLTASATGFDVSSMSYERSLDPRTSGVRKQSAKYGEGMSERPWRSLSAEELRRSGYVVDDAAGNRVFTAPDLDVLQSREFLEDHCMRVSRASGDSLLGIEFTPNRDRAKVADIAGTVWVDRTSAQLRRMEFGYRGLTVAESDA